MVIHYSYIKIKTTNLFINLEEDMKLLSITAEGLPLFKENLDLSFYAQQRVAEE